MKNILLIGSLVLNVALYTWYISSMEYKKLVDSTLTTWKNIITSDQVKWLWTVVTTEVNNNIWKEVQTIQAEKMSALKAKLQQQSQLWTK